jgi:hypothetical protein
MIKNANRSSGKPINIACKETDFGIKVVNFIEEAGNKSFVVKALYGDEIFEESYPTLNDAFIAFFNIKL